ncbi:hypothetical protein P7C71_g2905, partial [Lecanoromycetidae sp. Uapishka_2]
MSPKLSLLLAFLSFLTNNQVAAQQTLASGVVQIPAPNGNAGWCYYCSDDNAPPLCNSQCTTAINRLCGEDLTQALSTTEQDCQIKYLPPPYSGDNGQWASGARIQNLPSETDCINNFNGILADCGKDAGDPNTGVNSTYCTISGGGGIYGWNDDGSVVAGSAKYIVTTANTDQCGQAEASWQQATSVIQWNDSWIGPNDQVVLDTNPPPLTGAAAALATNIPTPNPECDTEVCDIFDNPYYSESPTAPWADGEKNMVRHRIQFEGWSEEPGSTRLFNALHDRCGFWPYNWQVYKNTTVGANNATFADFGLPNGKPLPPSLFADTATEPNDVCWCIPYAIFDASVGIQMAVNAFCDGSTQFSGTQEFYKNKKTKKRGFEGFSMFKSV